MKKAVLYCDGASSGNPGDSGIGVVVVYEGTTHEVFEHIGRATNNIAEYTALIRGLEKAHALKAEALDVFMDSELVVKQMNGLYRVKHENLIPLHKKAAELSKHFTHFAIKHIRREENKKADALSKKGVRPPAKPSA